MVHQQDFLREGLGGESGTVDDACTPMRCPKKIVRCIEKCLFARQGLSPTFVKKRICRLLPIKPKAQWLVLP
jgi:hypothetical protein